jgi:hypothetical protein
LSAAARTGVQAALSILVAAGALRAGEARTGEVMQMKTEIVESPIVSGTALRVRTTVHNDGAEAVLLPRPRTTSPLAYVVRGPDGSGVRSGNASDAAAARTGLSPPAPPLDAVAPGAAVIYEEDVSSFLGSPLPPGSFRMEVTVRRGGATLAAASAPFVVLPLSPEAAVRAVDGTGALLATLAVHRAPSGARTVYGALADLDGVSRGTLLPVFELAPGPVPALALALPAAAGAVEAWAAVLAPGGLRGALLQPWDVGVPFGPVAVPLRGPRLLEAGAPLPKGGAAFVLLGEGDAGPAAAVVRVDAAGGVSSAVLPVPAEALAGAPRLAVDLAGPASRAALLWTQGASEVWAMLLELQVPAAGAPRCVHRAGAGRVVGVQALAPGPGKAARALVLAVGERPDQPGALTRLSLGPPDATHSAPVPPVPPLPPPPLQKTAPPAPAPSWVLPSNEGGPPLWVAPTGTWALAAGAWQLTGLHLRPGQDALLMRYGELRLWISTWGPAEGLTLRALELP